MMIARCEPIESRILLAAAATDDQIIFTSNRNPKAIFVMNSDGSNVQQIVTTQTRVFDPVLSPDRTKIVFEAFTGANISTGELFSINFDGTGETRLTNNAAQDSLAKFSPDGGQIVFVSERDGNTEIYSMNADGSNQVNLTNDPAGDQDPSFSPDGRKIVFSSFRFVATELYLMDANGANPTRIPGGTTNETHPTFSPDGSQIAFFSDRQDAQWEIYVITDFSSRGGATRITHNALHEWTLSFSPDGSKFIVEATDAADGKDKIFTMNAANGGNLTAITDGSALDSSPNWASAPALAVVIDGILTINGTAAADAIVLAGDIENLAVTVNDKTQQISRDEFTSIVVLCGDGNDTLDGRSAGLSFYAAGSAGDDVMIGGVGNDTLTAGAGRNTLFGGDGNDRLNGSGGRDFLYCDAGNDRAYGNGGNDYIVGGSGVDRIWGGDGDDLLSGNSGNDKLFGEKGNDQILGGDGNDITYGDLGYDTLNGGKGEDFADNDDADTRILIELVD